MITTFHVFHKYTQPILPLFHFPRNIFQETSWCLTSPLPLKVNWIVAKLVSFTNYYKMREEVTDSLLTLKDYGEDLLL